MCAPPTPGQSTLLPVGCDRDLKLEEDCSRGENTNFLTEKPSICPERSFHTYLTASPLVSTMQVRLHWPLKIRGVAVLQVSRAG